MLVCVRVKAEFFSEKVYSPSCVWAAAASAKLLPSFLSAAVSATTMHAGGVGGGGGGGSYKKDPLEVRVGERDEEGI